MKDGVYLEKDQAIVDFTPLLFRVLRIFSVMIHDALKGLEEPIFDEGADRIDP
jgi:hypothetical protein